MGWFQRKPKFLDDEFTGVAGFLISCPEKPTPGAELLSGVDLDFSLDSLKEVDAFLEQMRERDLTPEEEFTLVVRVGAYVGEVIRDNAPATGWHWINYKDAIRAVPELASIGEVDTGSAVLLWSKSRGCCFPMGKVIKYLINGSEDSVHFFALVAVDRG